MSVTTTTTTKNKFVNGLFIFRRDLRIVDNHGLHLLSRFCEKIYTIFIFTPEQVSGINDYKSINAVQFMIESLEDLKKEIYAKGGQLMTFYGSNEKVVLDCIQELNIDLVCFNLDITPYARERDEKIIQLCEKNKTHVIYDWDYYLLEPDQIVNGSGEPYQKFTPYYENAKKRKVETPLKSTHYSFSKTNKSLAHEITLTEAFHKFVKHGNPDLLVHGGRNNALQTLKNAQKTQKHYSKTHNNLSQNTSLLSAPIKFGCVSIREVYYALKNYHDLIRQLYWREFYSQIMYHFPQVLGHALKPNYNKIKWPKNEKWFKAWCSGLTGFPVVDAGMRQLATTGWLHNRSRLIVASFLVKTLLIDWKKGEKYFAQTLVDYDPANNNGNWEWIMGGGADSQPFFRIFNPWEQGKHFDPDCVYIKTWIPELRDLDPDIIHNWDTEWENYKKIDYAKPICDYKKQKELVIKLYKQAF
jgi:deoxyribodipyrimidine photo-lyase